MKFIKSKIALLGISMCLGGGGAFAKSEIMQEQPAKELKNIIVGKGLSNLNSLLKIKVEEEGA